MYPHSFGPVPDNLSADQRAHWQRRSLTARHTLHLQAIAGHAANAETVAQFRCYVRGETPLAQAIAQVRAQAAQEHQSYRHFRNRRNLV